MKTNNLQIQKYIKGNRTGYSLNIVNFHFMTREDNTNSHRFRPFMVELAPSVTPLTTI